MDIKERIQSLSSNQKKEFLIQLQQHTSVSQSLPQQLVAFIKTSDREKPPTSSEITDFLSTKLPSHMIPTRVETIEEFPLTPNGKIDRRALANRTLSKSIVAKEIESTSAESTIAHTLLKIWKDSLGLQNISIQDNFFQIGGDSILAIKIISKAKKEGIDLSISDLFKSPTIAELVTSSNSNEASKGRLNGSHDSNKRNRDKPTLKTISSFAQERLWFIEKMVEGSMTFNMCAASRIKGKLDTQVLENGISEIVRRHEILRSKFPEPKNGASLTLELRNQREFRLQILDHSKNHDSNSDESIKRLIQNLADKQLNLEEGPLFKSYLVKISNTEHILCIVMHHIISDGWSFENFYSELSQYYNAIQSNSHFSLKPLPKQYSDFSESQRMWAATEDYVDQLNYWKNKLAGAPSLLELRTDYPRPNVQSYQGAIQTHQIGIESSSELKALGRELGVSSFVIYISVFKVLLSKLSNQTDIVVGTPVSNRTNADWEPLIGLFVNMLAIRNSINESECFNEIVINVNTTISEALAHQDLPFEQLIQEINPERNLSHSPIFQVAFMVHKQWDQNLQLKGMAIKNIPIASPSAQYDLTLAVTENDKGLKLDLEYATDLFSAKTALSICHGYEQLCKRISEDSCVPIYQISLMGADEKSALLERYSPPRVPYPKDSRVFELFEEQVDRTPDSIAVSDGIETLTYRELDAKANRIARSLTDLGAGPESLVGLCVGRTAELPAAMLGILKSGAAYLPLDESYPAERLSYMAEQSGMSVLLSRSDLLPLLPSAGRQTLLLDRDAEAIASQPESRLGVAGSSGDLAYAIYTSGSTGKPKGVEIEHRAAVNFLCSMAETPGISPGDTLLAVTTVSFDISVLELMLPLIKGARVCVADRETALDPEALKRAIRESGANVVQATPATWRMLLDSGWEGEPHMKVLCGGESLPPNLARILLPACQELWNMYGPTETTVWSTCCRVKDPEDIHVGRPVANTEAIIIDSSGQLAPPGLPGELLIGGDGLARGYRNRPDLTEKAFVPHPLKEGKKVYRTGDLVSYRPDGGINCLGRIDSQVKIRGHRVELGEIENALATCENVRVAAATTVTDGEQPAELAAYLVPIKKPLDGGSVRKELSSKLPHYMVPKFVIEMDSLPKTASGKLDRNALPKPGINETLNSPDLKEPQSQIEKTLAELWQKELGIAKVGITQNFFELGGHSFSISRIVSGLKKELGIQIPLKTFFELQTVADQAKDISKLMSEKNNSDALPPIRAVSRNRRTR